MMNKQAIRRSLIVLLILTASSTVPLLSGCAEDPLAQVNPTELAGNDGAPASEAIPKMKFEPGEKDYADGHPDAPGALMSFNTLHLSFTLDTTVSEANAILEELGAEIVGGTPGTSELEGVVQVRLPSASHAELTPICESLRNNPKIKLVVPDIQLELLLIPPAKDEIPAPQNNLQDSQSTNDWSWEARPSGGNIGLEIMRVPQMWNLNAAVQKSGSRTLTGIVDGGFDIDHPDVTYVDNLTPGALPFLDSASGTVPMSVGPWPPPSAMTPVSTA